MIPSLAPDRDLLAQETTPRRRRNGLVCSSLRVDGQPVTMGDFAALGVRFVPSAGNLTRLSQLDLYCTERHDTPGAGWTMDICTSSWQRDCPFKAVTPLPSQPKLPTMVVPVSYFPKPLPPKVEQPKASPAFLALSPAMHAARIRASLKTLGMTHTDASRVLAKNDSYVAVLLSRTAPRPWLEALDAVLDVMLAGRRQS